MVRCSQSVLRVLEFTSFLGWHVYTQNLWSFLDVTFSIVFGVYLVLRIRGWHTGDLEPSQQAMDVLAMGAPVLVPRLAFNLMSENMLFVSLRAMMKDFTVQCPGSDSSRTMLIAQGFDNPCRLVGHLDAYTHTNFH